MNVGDKVMLKPKSELYNQAPGLVGRITGVVPYHGLGGDWVYVSWSKADDKIPYPVNSLIHVNNKYTFVLKRKNP